MGSWAAKLGGEERWEDSYWTNLEEHSRLKKCKVKCRIILV
jgi:hypothetical protein